ncbi:MAG: UvrD-helicase domain-containing protein [Planctomycetaceae bacterium]
MDDLTPSQRQAVSHFDGPLLVLAGPGSGKTRVVTRRIAHLVESGVPPSQILAITFTNKAAEEMSERVKAILPAARVWVSTFHRFCARLLRRHASVVGLESNYTILDTGDQKTAMRRVMHDLDLDPVHYTPDRIAWHISTAKNDLVTAEMYARRYEEQIGDHWQATVARVYPAYQKWLLDSNAVDFDDLLLHVAVMLAEHEELRNDLDERFRYVLVDEYQDTNIAQYQIVRALSQQFPNLCVTGDPDQSIYGWRGARIANILRFEQDYPDAKVIRLEDNFRSTRAILRSADALITHNTQRKDKRLITQNPEGESVKLLRFPDSHLEADGIARQIREQVEAGEREWTDFAIFYRVNALSRQLENALMRHRVPFQVAAGVAFYDRTEIKDMLGYLRLVYNAADRAAFLRVVNKPLRGLGKTSQDRLVAWAAREGVDFIEAARRATEIPKLSKRAVSAFRKFAEMLDDFSLADAGSVENQLTSIIERTGYTKPWEGSPVETEQQQLANVQELVSAARQFDATFADETSLEGFLEQTCLVNETDSLDKTSGQVTMMTLHAAKGLEFPVVYIVGVEEGLLPHERATRENDPRELEEERRLLFVGITRAQEKLSLTETARRSFRGRDMMTIRSPFVSEIECETVDCMDEAFMPEWQQQQLQESLAKRRESSEDQPLIFDNKPMLMTAADLLNGVKKSIDIPFGFRQGMLVRHPRYGRGTVTATDGHGPRRTVTVKFEDSELTKTFHAAKSPLQPIGR